MYFNGTPSLPGIQRKVLMKVGCHSSHFSFSVNCFGFAAFAQSTQNYQNYLTQQEEDPFFTATCGTAERLPNGNTLITESDNGRAFEVTPDKEIVWEFYNPHRAGPDDEYIATLFEVIRLPSDFPTDWVGDRTETAGGEP